MMKKSITKDNNEGWGELVTGGLANAEFSSDFGALGCCGPKQAKGDSIFGSIALGGMAGKEKTSAPVSANMLDGFARVTPSSKKEPKSAKGNSLFGGLL